VKDLSHLADPERAAKNIDSFRAAHPDLQPKFEIYSDQIAALFSCSQFLANYCIQHPEQLFNALERIYEPFNAQKFQAELYSSLQLCSSLTEGMKIVRRFRKDKQIIITLKDILHLADLPEIMFDMSSLADIILVTSLHFVESFLVQRYGKPEHNAVALIGLGKLGARELN
jgi:glutamate-ammonia-ligase adenylyltransferase